MAPNNIVYLDIIEHFMGTNSCVKTVLLDIKHAKDSDKDKNFAFYLIKLIDNY